MGTSRSKGALPLEQGGVITGPFATLFAILHLCAYPDSPFPRHSQVEPGGRNHERLLSALWVRMRLYRMRNRNAQAQGPRLFLTNVHNNLRKIIDNFQR